MRIDSTFGFMKKLYRGSFDETLFRLTSSDGRTERVKRITDSYDTLIKDYPPGLLEEAGGLPPELIGKLGEIGIFGLMIPEEYGGRSLSLSEYLAVVEHIAATDMAVAITPLAHISIGIKGILLFGNEDQKRRYLPKAATGETIFAYALTEPKYGSDAQHLETRAELSPDGARYVLSGQKTYITNGGYAGGFVVFAQMDPAKPGYMGAFIVERNAEGVHVGPNMKKMGLAASSTTMIRFDKVSVQRENLLAKPGDGFRIAMTILNYGRLGLGAASAGVIGQSIRDMLSRADSRIQFGSRISSFELIQEKIARARVRLFEVSSVTSFTAKMLEHFPLTNVAEESSHCKLFSTHAGWETLYDALQVAGGAGYLSSLPYEKRMRDFRVTTVFEGTSEIHSMYPAFFLGRDIGRELSKPGFAGRFLTILGLYAGMPRIRTRVSMPLLGKGLRLARRNIALLRRNTLAAVLRYGSGFTSREYLARRLTQLSLDAYILISCAGNIMERTDAGEDTRGLARLYAFVLEESREHAKTARRFGSPLVESSVSEIMHDLRNERVED